MTVKMHSKYCYKKYVKYVENAYTPVCGSSVFKDEEADTCTCLEEKQA